MYEALPAWPIEMVALVAMYKDASDIQQFHDQEEAVLRARLATHAKRKN